MPALNFQARFAADVESGRKAQSIRAYRKDERDPKPGQPLSLFTGMRTKACRKLGLGLVTRVRPIEIRSSAMLLVEGCQLSNWQANAIARADGFEGVGAMLDWFEATHGLPFRGLLIEWVLLLEPAIAP